MQDIRAQTKARTVNCLTVTSLSGLQSPGRDFHGSPGRSVNLPESKQRIKAGNTSDTQALTTTNRTKGDAVKHKDFHVKTRKSHECCFADIT